MSQFLLERIRDSVHNSSVRFTEHSYAELLSDRLTTVDAESAVLTGAIVRIQPENSPEEPGPRYTLVGHATDLNTKIGVVCRFEPDEQLIIITCYEIK